MLHHALRLLAAVAVVKASPFPQGVTQAIAPSGMMPPGCSASYDGTFGIAVQPLTASSKNVATQSADGQPAAGTSTAGVVTQISDAQPQAPTGAVSQIGDGQPQAASGAVSQIGDGQPQAGTMTMHAMSQISDGQIQAPYSTVAPVSQISDAQPQAPTGAAASQIGDGQPQAPTAAPVSQISDAQPQAPTGAASQIADGQPQAPTAAASQIADGQPQAPTAAASQISDGQPQAPTAAASQLSDGQPQASTGSSGGTSSGPMMIACQTDSTLALTLSEGILLDSKGRTGYIAANYQFQFDKPAQTGAIYTAGFSVCSNGSLALGDSNIFYRCLSGDFYNLYNENWAPQCEAVTVHVVKLVSC